MQFDTDVSRVSMLLGWTRSDLVAYLAKHAEKHLTKGIYGARSKNSKVGNTPRAGFGLTREKTLASCTLAGCALRHVKDGGKGGSGENPLCYSLYGTPAFGHSSSQRAYTRNPDRYSPDRAISGRHRLAKMVRIGTIGDPSTAERPDLYRFIIGALDAGLDPIGYTHAWREDWAQDLRPWLRASCETALDVSLARAMGWVPVVTQRTAGDTWDTSEGLTRYTGDRRVSLGSVSGIVCPAMIRPKAITCNRCRVCRTRGPLVVFPDHGPTARVRS